MKKLSNKIWPVALIVALQAMAAAYFIIDALSDESDPKSAGAAGLFEVIVALALLAGIVLGAATIAHLTRENRIRSAALAIARGALSAILVERFASWGLSVAEADVALFALKGCKVAEIAEMRGAAPGTVRAQLSQVYAKAGVTSQAMLMSLFLEDLMSEDGLQSTP